MAEALSAEASSLFVDECYEEALEKYTEAIKANPTCSTLYVQRAATHLKLTSYTDALEDANQAIKLNPNDSKGYLRKGVACFSLEEFVTAKSAFEAANQIAPSASLKTWIRKCEAEIEDEEEEEEDEEIEEISGGTGPRASPAASLAPAQPTPSTSGLSTPSPQPPPPPATPAAPAPKYRHEWYQTADKVTISVFAKKLPVEQVEVVFSETGLIVTTTGGPDGTVDYTLNLTLFAPVTPDACKFQVLTTKIEITLKKATQVQWVGLEGSGSPSVPQPINMSSVQNTARPAYPTSKKTKAPVDWDKLESELKEEEKNEKLEGDGALNKLFKDIYSNADEDTRRAMNKSFAESNGTVLSTNWSDVGSKYVEGSPPTGMEMKKYEH